MIPPHYTFTCCVRQGEEDERGGRGEGGRVREERWETGGGREGEEGREGGGGRNERQGEGGRVRDGRQGEGGGMGDRVREGG